MQSEEIKQAKLEETLRQVWGNLRVQEYLLEYENKKKRAERILTPNPKKILNP